MGVYCLRYISKIITQAFLCLNLSKNVCRKIPIHFLSITFLSGCAIGTNGLSGKHVSKEQLIANLHIVDCMLPGLVQVLGNKVYVSPRRPVKTTAADCNRSGGEFTAYDRADPNSALRVWLPEAEEGDANAQVNVGEIYEQGLNGEPNYIKAANWYQKAAQQGDRRGQFNLGALYEQGLGVQQDRVKALDLYRQAWGLPKDHVIFQSEANKQIQRLQNQINELQDQSANADEQALIKINDDRKRLINLVAELRAKQQIPHEQELNLLLEKVSKMQLGRFHALVIGNQNYDFVDDLITAENDAKKIAGILKDQYGFKVKLLINADQEEILNQINRLNKILTQEDNLLIYYAGHGNRVRTGPIELGYWLPVDADSSSGDPLWVSNEFITGHLERNRAKRVLVLADSCYKDILFSPAGQLYLSQNIGQELEYIRSKLPRRSRLLITSGSDQPVVTATGQGHSVFARVLIDTLQNNKQIISAPNLFLTIRDQVHKLMRENKITQVPDFKSIKRAGHEAGDFFFVPKRS